jgi:hypothetical protein
VVVDELSLDAPVGAGGGDPLSALAGTVNTALAINTKKINAERDRFRSSLLMLALLFLYS